ncbi:S66 peptidase family protein [Natrinema sp. H-ect1]|uniref:S66 family peptidase n=1 Tax=Natrinema sp. H-ect1 TaxID=3242700 RepID=UPI00359EC07F
MPSPIHPPPAQPGDTVAILAPSSMVANEDCIDIAVERLRSRFDLEPVLYETAQQNGEYLREHPRERAADVMRAFEDPDISAAIAVFGGDDQLRILKHLDPDILRENPTRFFGYSDNCNLSLYLWNLGIVSYSGGQVMPDLACDPELHSYTAEYLRRAFFEERLGELHPASEWSDRFYDFDTGEPREWFDNHGWEWYGPSTTVEGRLWGGCFEIISWHLQTERYVPDTSDLEGAVLVLETADDAPDAERIGWTLMCMGERRLLQQFDAVLVGRPATFAADVNREEYCAAQREAILEQIERYNPGIPLVFGLDYGHTDPCIPLPLGADVTVDATKERISV